MQKTIDNLYEYLCKVFDGQDGHQLYYQYKEEIEKITPRMAFSLFYKLLEDGMAPKEVLEKLDKLINVFYQPLTNYKWKKPDGESLSFYLLLENQALQNKLEEMKEIIKKDQAWHENDGFTKLYEEIKKFPVHYKKKENLFFPLLEKKHSDFKGLTIMWTLHDMARRIIKDLPQLLQSSDERVRQEGIGEFFFILYGLILKEDLIFFPVISELLDEAEEKDLLLQSFEYKYFSIKNPSLELNIKKEPLKISTFPFSEDIAQYLMLFDSLPFDLTYVDENNKVRYFNQPEKRFFPRSPAVIGRDVENCHPHESVGKVLKIIEDFKQGKKEKERFWINFRDKILLIEYYPVFDKEGVYKGVLEVSQDISQIKNLEGEKRL